jgi:hypothetical protein
LALLKGKNLALGNLGLILDGLAQESGALMRPMIEYMEQLKLFKQSPESAEQAMSGILQTAGVVAKAVDGIHRELREHLNENASHKSFSHHSTSHLIKPDGSFCKQQQFVPHVLDLNLQTFCVELYLLLESGANALPLPLTQGHQRLVMAVDRLLSRMNHVFELGHSWDTTAS